MTILARKVKVISSKFTGKRLYNSSSNLGLDFCVRTQHNKRDLSHLHLIDRSLMASGTKGYVPPLPLGPDPPRVLCSAASYGSKVYISGGFDVQRGCETAKNEVFCMDTHHPENGWKELAPMNCERSLHSSIFFGEKMYVWGDLERWEDEVYDKNLNKWDFLDELPKEVVLRGMESTWLSSYNVLGLDYRMACVGGMVYALHRLGPGDFLAYDPFNPSTLKPVANSSELQDYLPGQWLLDEYHSDFIGVPEHFLISLGDDILGVVWLHIGGYEELLPDLEKIGWAGTRNLRYSKFRMKHMLSNGQLEFVAEPIDRFSCLILGTDMSNCVAVEPLVPRNNKVMAESNIIPEHVEMKRKKRVYPQEEGPFGSSTGDEEKEKAFQILEKLLRNKKAKKEEMWAAIVEAVALMKPKNDTVDKGEEEVKGPTSRRTKKKATVR